MANMYDISALTMLPSTNMEWYTKAIFGGKLIEKGRFTPIVGVKDTTKLNLLDIAGNILQADSSDCAWTPQQIAKLSDKELKVKTYKINLEQCIDDLERKRTIWMLTPGAKNTELPDSLEDATMAMLSEELSKEVEAKIISGDSSKNENDFDGAIKILKESAESIKVSGIALTKENVLAEVEKMFVAMSENAEDALTAGTEDGNLCFYVSSATILKIKMALSGVKGENVVIMPNWTVVDNEVRYMDVPFDVTKGIATNDMILAQTTNMIIGTDLMSDVEEMRLGQFAAPHDSKIFIDGRLRLGFVIPFEDEAVIYSPDITAPDPAKMSAPVTEFSIDLSEEKLKPFVANETNVETLQSWLALEQAKAQTRSGVSTLIQKRIDELTKTE